MGPSQLPIPRPGKNLAKPKVFIFARHDFFSFLQSRFCSTASCKFYAIFFKTGNRDRKIKALPNSPPDSARLVAGFTEMRGSPDITQVRNLIWIINNYRYVKFKKVWPIQELLAIFWNIFFLAFLPAEFSRLCRFFAHKALDFFAKRTAVFLDAFLRAVLSSAHCFQHERTCEFFVSVLDLLNHKNKNNNNHSRTTRGRSCTPGCTWWTRR